MARSKRLSIGLIGCGAQGRFLAEAVRVSGRATLTACADINTDAVNQAVKQCGFDKGYTNVTEMLAHAPIDAVVIATTHDQLFPQAMAAVGGGKHVLVEKPIALNAADGQILADAAHSKGVTIMPGYSLRFMPERQLMRKLLDQNAIGDVVQVVAGQLIPKQGGWLSDRQHGGGPLYYIGSHVIDQLLWVIGRKPIGVFAVVDRPGEDHVEDAVNVTLKFEHGITAQLCISQKIGGRYGYLDVIGAQGRMRSQWERPELFIESQVIPAYRYPTLVRVPGDADMPPHAFDAQSSLVAQGYTHAWSAEVVEFIDAIEGGRPPAVTVEDGIKVLNVIDAIFASERAESSCLLV